jgi:ATP-binding cassette subfamily B multidrug efflux pump
MKEYIKYMRGNWKYAILAPILIMIDTVGMMVQPYFLQKIIDIGVANNDMGYIIKTGAIMVGFALISLVGGFFAMFFSSRAAYGFSANLRQQMLDKIQEFSFNSINKFSTSSLVTRLTNDIEVIQNLVQMMLRITIRAPFMLIIGVFMTISISSKVAMIFVIITPLLALIITLLIKKAFPLFRTVQKKIDKVNSVIRENLIGARVIKSFVREPFEQERFQKANHDLRDTTINSFNLIILLMPLVILIMNFSVWFILWISKSGSLEVGQISAVITYILLTLMSLIFLSMVFMNFSRAKASSDRILEVLGEETDIKQVENAVTKKIEKGLVEYNIKTFAFRDSEGEPILNNINFTINPRTNNCFNWYNRSRKIYFI